MPMSHLLTKKIWSRTLTDFKDSSLIQEIHIGYHIPQNTFVITDLIHAISAHSWRPAKTPLITIGISLKSTEKGL